MGFLIDMIHVEQGDAFLLTLGTQTGDVHVLIDAGPASSGKTVAEFCKNYAGGVIDAAFGTHLDNDHIGGFATVVEQCTVRRFFLNLPQEATLAKLWRQRWTEQKKGGPTWDLVEKNIDVARRLECALRARGIAPESAIAGMQWTVGHELVLRALNRSPERLQAAWDKIEAEENDIQKAFRELIEIAGKAAPQTSEENNSSIVLDLVYKGIPYALFTGDAGADVIRDVTAGNQYPFIKVSHHGSKTGLDEELAAQLRPSTAFIPVGDNSYGHPACEVLDMLKEVGDRTFCSTRTRHCRRDCPAGGFGNLCHTRDRSFRAGWGPIDPGRCVNNHAE